MKDNLPANNVVVAWWDYGDWLTDLGNVTTLCDNTTYNTTQIENVGYIMMGNENQSMQMLNVYNNYNNPGRVNYILVFLVLEIVQSSSGTHHTLQGLLDTEMKENGSGWQAFQEQTKANYIKQGYMSTSTTEWTDEISLWQR